MWVDVGRQGRVESSGLRGRPEGPCGPIMVDDGEQVIFWACDPRQQSVREIIHGEDGVCSEMFHFSGAIYQSPSPQPQPQLSQLPPRPGVRTSGEMGNTLKRSRLISKALSPSPIVESLLVRDFPVRRHLSVPVVRTTNFEQEM